MTIKSKAVILDIIAIFFVLNLFAGIKNNISNKKIYGNLISPINTPVAK